LDLGRGKEDNSETLPQQNIGSAGGSGTLRGRPTPPTPGDDHKHVGVWGHLPETW